MDAEGQEKGIEEAAEPMERTQAELEHDIEKLGEHIDEAHAAAAKRPEADSDVMGDVAGDWEDEATGSSQGEDADDAASEKAPEAHDREASTEES